MMAGTFALMASVLDLCALLRDLWTVNVLKQHSNVMSVVLEVTEYAPQHMYCFNQQMKVK